MAHELPPLPYDYSALEPCHRHGNHEVASRHASRSLREELKRRSGEASQPAVQKRRRFDSRSELRSRRHSHCGSQQWRRSREPHYVLENHEAARRRRSYRRNRRGDRPTFGNFNDFKTKFNDAGAKQFGSGWVWLAGKTGGDVQVISTPNQDNPMSQGLFPIFGNDVWEHAYYLKYNNRRPEYLAAWWNAVNWDEINRRYAAFKSGK